MTYIYLVVQQYTAKTSKQIHEEPEQLNNLPYRISRPRQHVLASQANAN